MVNLPPSDPGSTPHEEFENDLPAQDKRLPSLLFPGFARRGIPSPKAHRAPRLGPTQADLGGNAGLGGIAENGTNEGGDQRNSDAPSSRDTQSTSPGNRSLGSAGAEGSAAPGSQTVTQAANQVLSHPQRQAQIGNHSANPPASTGSPGSNLPGGFSSNHRYRELFTADYNPDPDLAADNQNSHPNAATIAPQAARYSAEGYPTQSGERAMTPGSGLEPAERYQRQPAIDPLKVAQAPSSVIAIASALIVLVGFTLGSLWLTLVGSLVAFLISLRLLMPTLQEALNDLSAQQRALLIAVPTLVLGSIGLISTSGIARPIARWGSGLRWDVVSALGDFLGAIGQIFIAILAVYVAWRQYVISRDLTVQQNLITQQQTIDAYFQGISELVLDDEGLLEDWPQERVIAEARTAAILSSVDAEGKAKVLRFLSRSKLLTPLARDQRLGRPILDGFGGYAEDRIEGTRVIDLGVMLAASKLAGTDLRWLDLSDANLIRADLSNCDLVRTNLARSILCDANLSGTDVMGVRFFYGNLETATPRTRQDIPNHSTGEFTGAVIEGADFTNVQRLSEVQRCYCCQWGGSKTRATIPGGCDGIPNRLGR